MSYRLILMLLFLPFVPVAAQQPKTELRCHIRSVVEWEISGPTPSNNVPPRSILGWNIYPLKARREVTRQRLRKARIEVYDRNRRLIIYTAYKEDGGILYSDRNIYDVRGRLIRRETIHSKYVYLPDVQLYSYAQNGRLSEVKGYDSAGQLLGGHLYAYDSAGNLIEDKSYSAGANLVYSNHVRRHEHDPQENRFGTKNFSYKGRDIHEETERFPDGRLKRRISYAYVFDRYGNWVKQIRREWTAEGVGSVFEPVTRTIRKIEYYPNPCAK